MVVHMSGTPPRLQVILAALLGFAALSAYLPAFPLQFTNYDDPSYVTDNLHVLRGVTGQGIVWAFTNATTGNWHPLTWLSYMLDCQLFGPDPVAAHLVNLALHAANVILLFLLLCRITGRQWRCALVAAIFALHPLHVESVAWVSERKDVLSAFFGLLCLWWYAGWAETQRPAGGQKLNAPARSRSLYLLALVSFACGLMSKAMLVTWPFVMLLLDFWPLRRTRGVEGELDRKQLRRLFVEKLPFFALSLVFSIITLVAQRAGGAIAPIADVSLRDRAVNALLAYGVYVQKSLWPVRLSVIYPYSSGWSAPAIIAAITLLSGITLAAISQRKSRPYLFTGWFWYVGTLVPVIGLIQVGNQAMADRYTYLPSIGLWLALVWLVAHWAESSLTRQRLVNAGSAVALALFWVATFFQAQYWKNTESLFLHAVSVTGRNFVACNSLGAYYLEQGRLKDARNWYEKALEANPSSVYAFAGLGRVALGEKDYPSAVSACSRAIQLSPSVAEAHTTLATALVRLGRTADAIPHYKTAVRLRPDSASARYNLGNALAAKGDIGGALVEYRSAVELDPKSADAHNNVGYMLLRLNEPKEAIRQFELASELKTNFWQAEYGLASAFSQAGDEQNAIAAFAQVLRHKPDLAEAMNGFAWILATSTNQVIRDPPTAIRLAERACGATGNAQPSFLLTLGAAYAAAGQFDKAESTIETARSSAARSGQKEITAKAESLLEAIRKNRNSK